MLGGARWGEQREQAGDREAEEQSPAGVGKGAGVTVAEEREVLGVLRGDIGEGSGAASTDPHLHWDWKPTSQLFCNRTPFYKWLCLLGV